MFRHSLLSLLLLLLSVSACGTNTSVPVYPLLTVFNPVGTPAIKAVRAVESASDSLLTGRYQIYFEIDYFVTNTEKEFIGYNLYISGTSASPDQIAGGTVYLPDGIMPSFRHSSSEASTASGSLITQTVKYMKAPPDQVEFHVCEVYYFSLAALTRNGIQSSRSAQVSGCAVTEEKAPLCDPLSPCYKNPTSGV